MASVRTTTAVVGSSLAITFGLVSFLTRTLKEPSDETLRRTNLGVGVVHLALAVFMSTYRPKPNVGDTVEYYDTDSESYIRGVVREIDDDGTYRIEPNDPEYDTKGNPIRIPKARSELRNGWRLRIDREVNGDVPPPEDNTSFFQYSLDTLQSYSRPKTQNLLGDNVRLTDSTALFSYITAFLHFYQFFRKEGYKRAMDNKKHTLRWCEYGITSALMIFNLANASGVTEIDAVFGVAALTSVTNYFGYVIENVDTDRAKYTNLALGFIPYALPFITILLRYKRFFDLVKTVNEAKLPNGDPLPALNDDDYARLFRVINGNDSNTENDVLTGDPNDKTTWQFKDTSENTGSIDEFVENIEEQIKNAQRRLRDDNDENLRLISIFVTTILVLYNLFPAIQFGQIRRSDKFRLGELQFIYASLVSKIALNVGAYLLSGRPNTTAT